MDQPLITIGLVCFNSEDSLDAALQCMFSQSWSNFEIVVVDDFSADSTWSFLQNIVTKHDNIRVYRNEKNRGVGASRERVVLEAKGDFIVFFDGDDYSTPDRLQKQYDCIIGYEQRFLPDGAVICHASRDVTDINGRKWFVKGLGVSDGLAPSGTDVADYLLLWEQTGFVNGSIGTGVQMARRSAYVDAGNFDPEFRRCEDSELAVRWALMGGRFVGVQDSLVRQNFSVTKKKIELDEFYTLRMFEKHEYYYKTRGAYRFMRFWIKSKYAYLSSRKVNFIKNFVLAFFCSPLLFVRRLCKSLKMFNYNRMLKKRIGR